MRSAKSKTLALVFLEAYSILLLLFLDVVIFWEKYEDQGFKAVSDSKKNVTDLFDVLFVDELPSQENK